MSRARHQRGTRRTRLAAALVAAGLLAAGLAVPAGAEQTEPRFLTAWGGPPSGSGDGQFSFPGGVAVAPDGTVYVTDRSNHRVQVFTADGDHLDTWGGPSSGSDDGEFDFLHGVAVAPDGTVYVADSSNHRIQVFTADGDHLDTWGGTASGSGDGEFNFPIGVAVAADGTVYVVDPNNHRIQYFSAAGDFQGEWGGLGSGDGAFASPRAVAVAPDGTVYVVDLFNHRIQYFTPTGDFQGEWGVGSSEIDEPIAMAVGPDGTVHVSDASSRIQYFSPAGDFLGEWGELGPGDGQFNSPAGVAVAPDSTVYVADTFNHRIQRFAFPAVTRLAGANRFATASAISQHHHVIPQAVGTVFVATGANFPDALAGAVAAASSQAPLLLTASLPEATEDELGRLDPDDIVILGGPAAVPDATEAALSAFGTTQRLSGANRYETAIAISQHAFGDGDADVVIVATGENFPDALAAAPLAAALGGPVLLTPPNTLPTDVADEIERLGPSQIYVVGGTSAVSATVFDALAALAATIRISGPNRYATAVEISETAFPAGAGIVYVAVGTNFPDALAGAAQAAFWGAPVLLTPTDALPESVADEITRLDPHTIVILGGEAVISPAVESDLEALLGT